VIDIREIVKTWMWENRAQWLTEVAVAHRDGADEDKLGAKADDLLARLDALGLAVVPKEPSEEAIRAWWKIERKRPYNSFNTPTDCGTAMYRAMIEASKP